MVRGVLERWMGNGSACPRMLVKLSGGRTDFSSKALPSEAKTRTGEEVFKLKDNFGMKTNGSRKKKLSKKREGSF